MKFLEHGPELPPPVLTAHEQDRLVFYCGAGISIGAGFPTFGGLVDAVYRELKAAPSELEQIAYKAQQYDRTLGLLENRVRSPRVRAAVRAALRTPSRATFPVHQALLRLATDKFGARSPRLVTTNFDNLFDRAASAIGMPILRDTAPALPVPKPSHWRSIVYLHGALEPTEREQLVYTSADFGRAYLTEAWAAKFVTTLCQHFTVLFVGYSLEDPVLRYIMDALASERNAGGPFNKAYAIAHYEDAAELERKRSEWRAKGVEPILYLASRNDHSRLDLSLLQWADLWTQGLQSKTHLAVDLGISEPSGLTPEERSQFDWALEDETALKAFCALGERAPLSWLAELPAFFRDREDHLERLGWWAAHHIDNPALVEAFCDLLATPARSPSRVVLKGIKRGVSNRLSLGKHHLDRQRQNEWVLLLLCDTDGPSDMDSADVAAFMEAPFLAFNSQLSLHPIPELVPSLEGRLRLRCRIDLGNQPGTTKTKRAFDRLSAEQRADLAHLLTMLLREAIEYRRLVGAAQPGFDLSSSYRPSIRPSNQNLDSRDWRILIEFLRRAAEHLDELAPDRIRGLVAAWLSFQSPLFDRLALHIIAASQNWTTSEKLELLQ